MSRKDPDLLLQTTPVLRQDLTTPRAMRDVWLALLPVVLASVWFFGIGALISGGMQFWRYLRQNHRITEAAHE